MFQYSVLFLFLCVCVDASSVRTNEDQIHYVNTSGSGYHPDIQNSIPHEHVFHSLIRNRVWDSSRNVITITHHTHHDPSTPSPTTIAPTPSPTTPSPITTQPPTTQPPVPTTLPPTSSPTT